MCVYARKIAAPAKQTWTRTGPVAAWRNRPALKAAQLARPVAIVAAARASLALLRWHASFSVNKAPHIDPRRIARCNWPRQNGVFPRRFWRPKPACGSDEQRTLLNDRMF